MRLFILLAIMLPIRIFAQTKHHDIIYLNTGDSVICTILSKKDNGDYSVKFGGEYHYYKASEVKSTTKYTPSYSDNIVPEKQPATTEINKVMIYFSVQDKKLI